MSEKNEILKFLQRDFNEAIRDPIWKNIYLNQAYVKLISTQVFQDLHDIKQLGPAYLVYPGATHSRFSHSLGTFYIAQRIIKNLVRKTDSFTFSLAGVKAFLAAALLHDLGHYPFAHALKNLGLLEHEALTGRLLLEDPLATIIREQLSVNPAQVAAIVDSALPAEKGGEEEYFRKLLSGVLDPDKLDYLNRDAYYCGVPYGLQDVDFFLEELLFDKDNGLALTLKGITAVENILFSKYLMYKTVYWHKTVRIATAMIKKALYLALNESIIRPEDLYFLTDKTLRETTQKIDYPPFRLINSVFSRTLYKLVYKIPYKPELSSHQILNSIDNCFKLEKEIIDELSSLVKRKVRDEEVIIDLPEEISFEINLKIIAEKASYSFPDRHSFFEKTTALKAAENLRFISLIINPDEELITAVKKILPHLKIFMQ